MPAERRGSSANVIGILIGTDAMLRDDVALVNAHYDHIGIAAPVHGDSAYNGADDNASEVVAMLEVARASKAASKRSMVFIALTGGEMGLLGSEWYVRHPAFPLSKTVARVSVEMIGRPYPLAGGSGKTWLTGYERSTMAEMLKAARVPLVPDRRPDQDFFHRSDNFAFAKQGLSPRPSPASA